MRVAFLAFIERRALSFSTAAAAEEENNKVFVAFPPLLSTAISPLKCFKWGFLDDKSSQIYVQDLPGGFQQSKYEDYFSSPQ